MTENEVLEYLKSSKRKNDMLGILPGSGIGNTIIKALEELSQYRAIGTLEECRAAMEKQTACNPEKVVEQLEDYLFEKYCVEGDSEIERIVKGGGADAKTDS